MTSGFVYLLEKMDARYLGGPMGTEHTPTIWVKVFSSIQAAKAFVIKDIGHSRYASEWTMYPSGKQSLDAMRYLYEIRKEPLQS